MNLTENLATRLQEIGAIKFGEFKLKSGMISPFYIDLRIIISYPDILHMVATAVWEKIKNINFDLICGVPYTALPVATAISLLNQKPMIMRRKEAKDYGTKKIIEGVFSPEQTCLIVEDIITSGTSIIETIVPLENEGLKIKDAVVLIDREQGGKKHLQEKGYNIHCIFTISEILEILRQAKKIDLQSIETVQKFISQNQT